MGRDRLGVLWPVALLTGGSLAAATVTASAVALSIAIVLTGIPLALGSLAGAGAVVMNEIGISTNDQRVASG